MKPTGPKINPSMEPWIIWDRCWTRKIGIETLHLTHDCSLYRANYLGQTWDNFYSESPIIARSRATQWAKKIIRRIVKEATDETDGK